MIFCTVTGLAQGPVRAGERRPQDLPADRSTASRGARSRSPRPPASARCSTCTSSGELPRAGFVRQEQVDFDDFLAQSLRPALFRIDRQPRLAAVPSSVTRAGGDAMAHRVARDCSTGFSVPPEPAAIAIGGQLAAGRRRRGLPSARRSTARELASFAAATAGRCRSGVDAAARGVPHVAHGARAAAGRVRAPHRRAAPRAQGRPGRAGDVGKPARSRKRPWAKSRR